MRKTYTLNVAGVTRELPLCPVNEKLDIAAFVMFSDVELTVACAEALLNVMKNCMEHTPCGGRLQVTWEGNPIYTQIRIADTGEGIPKEDLPHIFTRFYRGRNAHEDSVGIGLAMAKSIILQQNGDITADSYPGRGTTFSIRFYKTVV